MPNHMRHEEVWPNPYIGYLVYAPNNAQVRAVLCFLHGAGECAPLNIDEAMQKHGAPAHHINLGADFLRGVLVVCPQVPDRAQKHWTANDARPVCDIVNKAITDRGGNPNQIRKVLTGFSYGGESAFLFDNSTPGHWAALWAVAPTVDRLGATPVPAPGLQILIHYSGSDMNQWVRNVPNFGTRQGMGTLGRIVKQITTNPQGQESHHVKSCIDAYQDRLAYAWLLAEPNP